MPLSPSTTEAVAILRDTDFFTDYNLLRAIADQAGFDQDRRSDLLVDFITRWTENRSAREIEAVVMLLQGSLNESV